MKYIVLVDIRNEIIAREEKGQLKSGVSGNFKDEQWEPRANFTVCQRRHSFSRTEKAYILINDATTKYYFGTLRLGYPLSSNLSPMKYNLNKENITLLSGLRGRT